jgi:2-phosphoglycerate kinase
MPKTLVIDSAEATRTPFLRGVLTRSLHEAGLAFEEAYALASQIRHDLGDVPEITTAELRPRVLQVLGKNYGPVVRDAYEASRKKQPTILVRGQDHQVVPFSRSRHYLCLQSCGLSSEEAAQATARVYGYLIDQGLAEVSSRHIGHLTYCCLGRLYGRQVAHRYLVWVDYTHSGRPLIVLIGGVTGSGKSSVATEMAHRLGIVRTQSTDMLREVMRMLVPNRLLPVLHKSSFNAWEALPYQYEPNSLNAIADGYRSQMELLSLPCEAVIQRALRERVSLILEGVHVHPSLTERIAERERGDAIIVPVMLAVLKQKQLKKRLLGRGVQAPLRETELQLSHFDAIWTLQEFMLAEADKYNVPIIANEDKERAISLVLNTVTDALARNFTGVPRTVFL